MAKKTIDLMALMEEHRQNGNTTWILNAAIDNPKCIILGYNTKSVNGIRESYYCLLSKAGLLRKRKQKKLSENNKYPIFLSKNSDLSIYNKSIPIILDNSAVFK